MTSPIIIIAALDGLSKEASLSLAGELSDLVWGFKVHEILLRSGFEMIDELKTYGKIFADFKFYDIPSTVEKEVAALKERGADLISVHASGGNAMLEAAVRAGGSRVAAVTVLSSDSDVTALPTLARAAAEAGVRNIICSPHEIRIVREIAPSTKIITPGIRDMDDDHDDQSRTMSAREAIMAGADFLVIGRPITKAPNPRAALSAILSSLK